MKGRVSEEVNPHSTATSVQLSSKLFIPVFLSSFTLSTVDRLYVALISRRSAALNLQMRLFVKERNLNPKAACLKRREEEKVSGLDPQMHLGGGHHGLGGEGHM